MLHGFLFSRKLTCLVLAAWVIHLPLLLIQSQPNDVYVAISLDSTRSYLFTAPVVFHYLRYITELL